MNEADSAVLQAVGPLDRQSWLGVPFALAVVPMLLVDSALCIVAANSAAEQLFGTERLPGRSVTDFQCPDPPFEAAGSSAPWFAPPGDANLAGETRRTRVRVSGSTLPGSTLPGSTVPGSRLYVEVTVAAVRAPDGEQHFLVQVRDLTPAVRTPERQPPTQGHELRHWGDPSSPPDRVGDEDRDLRPAAPGSRQRDLLERLAEIEAHERSKLADSIHDEPIQRIVAALLRLDNLALHADEPVREEMDRIAVQLEMSVGWLRDLIVVTLSPSELRSSGLEPALTALADRIFAGTPTAFSVTSSPPVPLTIPGREAAYRILREGLLNVRNHALATRVTLQVEEQVDRIRFVLADNGVGARSLDAGRYGIATMRVRADAAGGVLSIESSPGKGTVVTLVLPLDALRTTGPAPSNARLASDDVTDRAAGR